MTDCSNDNNFIKLRKQMKKTFKWDGRYLTVETSTYRSNGNLALMVYEEGEEDYDIITVNIPDSLMQTEEFVYLDNNNYSWVERFIQDTGLGTHMGISTPSGFWTYPLYHINLKNLQ